MAVNLLDGIVRILDAVDRTIATGFVVSNDGLIVTCAHIFGDSPPEKAVIVFQATSERREARGIAEWWRAPNAEDVAFLRVDGGLPEGVPPLPLGSSDKAIQEKILTFGFPAAKPVEGIWASGYVIGLTEQSQGQRPLLQLISNEVTTGFSGSPVWSESRDRVIGMIIGMTSASRTIPEANARASMTVFATPAETLLAICPALRMGMKLGLDPKDTPKSAVNDKPTCDIKKDQLDFKPYVEALHEFITAKETTTPLAISIDGHWGTGKSSLMGMLKQKLEPEGRNSRNMLWQSLAWHVGRKKPISTLWLSRLFLKLGGVREAKKQDALLGIIAKREQGRPRQQMVPLFHPTVWFNAWKFSQEEQIWSALAVEVLNQLKKKYSWTSRLRFWFELTLKRSHPLTAAGLVLLNILPILFTVLLAIATAIYPTYILPLIHKLLPSTTASSPTASGGFFLGLATVISAAITGFKAAKTNPFKIPLKKVFDPPNYEEKIGYISRFEEDFKRIVDAVTHLSSKAWQTQKLVIFIDDLDRCRPLQSVNVIEAISLFLDSEQCVFVLGMDSAAVVTSIEAKYKELMEKMRHETPGIVSPGNLFLDKIIQISINIPRPKYEYINALIEELTHLEEATETTQPLLGQISDNSSTSGTPTRPDGDIAPPKIEAEYFKRDDVQNAIKEACKLLKENPRQVKRFINLFRLKVYLANRQGKLHGQNLTKLALAVVWSMQWPEVVKLLLNEPHSSEVRTYLTDICEHLQEDGNWRENLSRMNFEFDQVMDDLIKRRTIAKKFPTHWCHLPWEEWICDKDFRFCLKKMEDSWQHVKAGVKVQSQDLPELELTELMRL